METMPGSDWIYWPGSIETYTHRGAGGGEAKGGGSGLQGAQMIFELKQNERKELALSPKKNSSHYR